MCTFYERYMMIIETCLQHLHVSKPSMRSSRDKVPLSDTRPHKLYSFNYLSCLNRDLHYMTLPFDDAISQFKSYLSQAVNIAKKTRNKQVCTFVIGHKCLHVRHSNSLKNCRKRIHSFTTI